MADTARSNIKIIYQENGETVNRCEWWLSDSIADFVLKKLRTHFEIELLQGCVTPQKEGTFICFHADPEKLNALRRAFVEVTIIGDLPKN